MFCELVYNANTGLQSNAECRASYHFGPANHQAQLSQGPDHGEEEGHVKTVECRSSSDWAGSPLPDQTQRGHRALQTVICVEANKT